MINTQQHYNPDGVIKFQLKLVDFFNYKSWPFEQTQ